MLVVDRNQRQEDDSITDDPWIHRSRQAYHNSTDYLESSIFSQWKANINHFRGKHTEKSRYSNKNYIGRAKVFRPKTRSSERSSEAAMVAALFSTNDLIAVAAMDQVNEQQQASAAIVKEILQWRLSKRVPWYQTTIGAYQDAWNYGIAITRQSWEFVQEDVNEQQPLLMDGQPVFDTDGQPAMQDISRTVTKKDELTIDNIPPENFRFDPACDWRDPVGTSPYLIELIPMYAGEVLENMAAGQWIDYDLQTIRAHSTDNDNSVRDAREGSKRQDPTDIERQDEYGVIWLHSNIMRHKGKDWHFLTVGTDLMLTEPVTLEQVYPAGRPYVIGGVVIESHRNYPSGVTELSGSLQSEINDVANQRLDNVKLALNKRYFIRRGRNVDLDALKRNIPGGGVLMTDPATDVNVVGTPDVTQSSYAEQDRLSVEMDELVGNFSQSSIQTNRNLNETVGGMQMMQTGANIVQEYTVRTFIETWVEPVLRQCIKLIQLYETDETIVALAADKAQLWQRFGIDMVTDELLMQELTLNVDVGMGNINPQKRIERLMMGINATAQLPTAMARINDDEVIKEVFGALGYQDGDRFFKPTEEMPEPQPDPEAQKIQAQMEMEQQKLQLEQQKLQMQMQIEQAKLQQAGELAMMKMALDKDLKLADMQSKLGLTEYQMQQKDHQIQTQRDIAALHEQSKINDIDWKNRFAVMKYGDSNTDNQPIAP